MNDDTYRVGGPYAKYVLVVLIFVYVLNLLDRQILSILAEELKADLGVTDAQLGFLYGTSFAAFYAIFGLPLGRLADLWIRKSLIAVGLVFWSAMTMLSGTANGIVTLALYRFGVGAGEASATPATYSLLSDWFPPERRATALSIYSTGAYIGMGVSLGIGGLIVDFWKNRYPVSAEAPLGLEAWQVTFMIVGFPGILLALLVYAMREPERGISEGIKSDTHPHPFRETWYELMSIIPPFSIYNLYTNSNGRSRAIGLNLGVAVFLMLLSTMLARATDDVAQWTVLGVAFYCLFSWAQSLSLRDPPTFALIFKSKALRYVNLSYPFCTTIVYSYSFWVTPYFLRSFEVGIAEAGVVLGTTLALCGGVGVAAGGIMADFLRSRRPDLHVYMAVICAIMTTIAAHILLNAKDLQTAYIANAFVQFMAVLWSGAGSSLVTELVLPRMRATSSAFYVGFSSVTGLALGPYLVGRLSDAYTAQGVVPGEALGDGLKTVLFIYLVVVFFAVLARRHYLEDYNTRVSRAEAYGEPVARS
mgnify:FL=1